MSLQPQPVVTRAQVREVDRRAIEDLDIPGIVLMENAAKNAARIILDVLPKDGAVAIVCGRGNNGGDGFAIARHLFNARVLVELFLACDRGKLTGDADTNARDAEDLAPLHSAVVAGYADMAELLLAHGADISATYGRDQTPLHLAVTAWSPSAPARGDLRVAGPVSGATGRQPSPLLGCRPHGRA